MPTKAYPSMSYQRCKSGKENVHYPEAASQSFLAGQLIGVSTGGQLTDAIHSTRTIDTSTVGNGLVIADQNATGTTSTELSANLIDDETLLYLPLCTTDSQVDSAVAQVGDKYAGRVIDSTVAPTKFGGDMVGVDVNNTTNPVFRIVKFDRAEDIATSGNVHFAWVQVLVGARFKA